MTFLLIAGYPESLINFRGPLLDALLKAGLNVHVAAPDLPAGSAVRLQLESLGVRTHEINLKRVGMNPLADLRTLYQLQRLMRKIVPDFMMGYTIKPVIYGTLASWLARVPQRFALVTGLGYAFQGDGDQRSLLRRVVRFLYRSALSKAHKVFFQNPDDERLFYELGILNKTLSKSVVVNGSGIDVSAFRPALFPSELSFLLIARLLGDKGIREYVEAASIVKSQYRDVNFSLVGWIDDNPDSVHKDELERWIDSGDIEFLGRLEDVKTAIADCSVYVLPSYREGTPRTVLEAMAMGRPVITTDAPGCRETVSHGDNGFLVPVRAVDELAQAMLKFVDQPELITRMGARSRQIAEEKYDVNKVNSHMLHEMGIL
jgi:glycosyltransferase involved in cell wall biosynthesis